MKVRITMEADVTDLPAFNEDVSVLAIKGAGRENVWDVINSLRTNSYMKLTKAMCLRDNNFDPKRQIALEDAYKDEIKLTQQLVESAKIKYTK